MLAWVLSSTTGCGTLHVRPPTNVQDPVRVYVIDYGRTSRLVLPARATAHLSAASTPESTIEKATRVEYAYGDWNWYALNNDSLIDAAGALLIPTRATLGRRAVETTGTTASGHVGKVYTFTVSRTASNNLKDHLDAIIDDPDLTRVHNPLRNMTFVRLRKSYWLPNQSSTEMKSWLQSLGCRVRGWTLIAEFDFEPQQSDSIPTPSPTSNPTENHDP
jgi:hypothetical protein